MKAPWIAVLAFAAGALVASGAWTAFPRRAAPDVAKKDEAPKEAIPDDGDLRRANENLTSSLQACDRQLAELRARLGEPAPVASETEPAPDPSARGERFRRRAAETTPEDWERMAQLGVVRVRVPCIRDTPWRPDERAVSRLGLAPDDVKTIEEAYAASNERVSSQLTPLCASVVGSAEVAARIGASACIDAIQASARKGDARGAKESLTRVAEVQAGKRTGLANDPALCADRRVLRPSDEPVPGERASRGRRGGRDGAR